MLSFAGFTCLFLFFCNFILGGVPYASVSCIYGIGSVETYSEMTLSLNIQGEIERQKLLRRLTELQYKRNDINFARGTFRVRGDNIEVFPAHLEDRAWRISLFGDEIEQIWEFDPLTGEKTTNLVRKSKNCKIVDENHENV